MELIEKLKHNVKYHIRPYNLGDSGETETLIMELIRMYEAAQQSVHPTPLTLFGMRVEIVNWLKPGQWFIRPSRRG